MLFNFLIAKFLIIFIHPSQRPFLRMHNFDFIRNVSISPVAKSNFLAFDARAPPLVISARRGRAFTRTHCAALLTRAPHIFILLYSRSSFLTDISKSHYIKTLNYFNFIYWCLISDIYILMHIFLDFLFVSLFCLTLQCFIKWKFILTILLV